MTNSNHQSTLELNEGQARYILIDPELRRAGWKLDDHTQVLREVPVDGYDATPWNGVTDYCFYNAVSNRFEWADRRFISPAKYKEPNRYTVFPGDVLITIMKTCGRCAVVPDGVPTSINTKHLCCITLDQSKCLPFFLHGAFLHHPEIRRQLGVFQKGAIKDGLNMEIIKGLEFPLPPLHLQEHFAGLVERHERLRATQREALRQAEHLFQTLLHQAFSQAS